LAAAAVVFVIACSNVANLILARSVRREGELTVRAALGASNGALRRTLLAESLVLCGMGAVLGVLVARPMVAVVAQFAARFSVRALEVTVDSSLLWVGAGLAMAAAILLAYVPRLPSTHAPTGLSLASGSLRITPGTNRRLRLFATTQIAFSFVMLAAAGTLVAALIALQTANTAFNTRQVLAVDVPPAATGVGGTATVDFLLQATDTISRLPGVAGVAAGSFVPWRDSGTLMPRMQFTVEGYKPADGEENPHARMRIVAPNYFAVLGVPMIAGRDFHANDRSDSELVVVVSQSIAQRLFPNGEAINRKMWFTEALFGKPVPRRIVGVVTDVDDENVIPGPAMTVYLPLRQMGFANRLFVHASGEPYALLPAVTRVIRDISANQPIDRASTLEDIRAEVLAPERINAFVFSGFAGVALLIAVVGVSGVLAFGVSARTREFGVRLAVGSTPANLLCNVLLEGAAIVAVGIVAGAIGGYAFAALAASVFHNIKVPDAATFAVAAAVMVGAAILASLMPAARASRVDVLQALRTE
jgi:predicted permease